MSDKNMRFMSVGEHEPGRRSEHGNFTAPLGSVTSGRLVFASGVGGVTIQADATLPDLYRANFEQHLPSVQVQDGAVTIQYRRFSVIDRLISWRESTARLILNGSIPWELEFRGGVSKLTADLSGLPLRALDLSSVSQVVLMLPQPSGTVFVHISGSASDLTIHRPAGVAIRVHISGSASNLALDEQRFGAAADGIHWQTLDYTCTVNRYDITVSGSVSNMTLASSKKKKRTK